MSELDELLEKAADLRRRAPLELRGIEKEWPHHAEQARRSYRDMLADAEALERRARELADATPKSHPRQESGHG